MDKQPENTNSMIPAGKKRELKYQQIRKLYNNGKGYSMNQITKFGYSKTTVFLAIHKGRGKAKINNESNG